MADLEKIADELSGLTVLEAAELSKLLEEKWGVSAAAPVAVAAVAGAADGEAAAEEKDSFDVILANISSRPRRRRSRKALPRTRPTRSRNSSRAPVRPSR